jgi:hypothetical protein
VIAVQVRGDELDDDALEGVAPEEMAAVECSVCHDPHERTGNGVAVADGRDFQLRHPEVRTSAPSDAIADVTNPDRFNGCGQCHRSRGNTWQSSRGPHASVQSNVYTGEMPIPDGTESLVLGRISIHSFAAEQCATCHMYRQDFQDAFAPAIAGHTFGVNAASCANVGCHPSGEQALAAQAALQNEVQNRLDGIAERLGDPATWEYTSNGGPDSDGQDAIADEIKQVRFLYHYLLSDASLGVHNPAYARSILTTAELTLLSIGL